MIATGRPQGRPFLFLEQEYLTMNTTQVQTPTSFLARCFRRFGIAGLLFFTVKGLLWLALPVLLAQSL